MTRRLVRAAFAALTMLIAAVALIGGVPHVASAHTLASSTVRLTVGGHDLSGTVTVAVASIDKALDADERSDALTADAYSDQVIAYIDAHLTIKGADGTTWTEHYSNLVRQTTEGIETITVDIEADPGGADPSQFAISYDAVIEAGPDHEAVLILENDSGTVSTPGVFTHGHDTIEIGDNPPGVAIADMVGFGFHHVLDGADHLLFLLTLLLPASFIVVGRRWQVRRGVRSATRKVLHVVTAFTVGHSLTLAATSLGWVSVPSRPVEVLIAASVAVSAVHAIRPIVRGGEAMIAGSFGLIHGLAFAGILHDLGLQGRTSTTALLAFNIGIELAQLVTVALVLPSLYLLSTSGNATRVRIIGASIALAAAITWILDRIGILTNPLAGAERSLVTHPWHVVAVIAVLAATTVLLRQRRVHRTRTPIGVNGDPRNAANAASPDTDVRIPTTPQPTSA